MATTKKWGDNSTDDYNNRSEDAYIYKDAPDTTHDDDNIHLGAFATLNRVVRSLIRFDIKADLLALGAVVINSAKLYLYVNAVTGAHNVSAYRCVQDWNEAQLTWNSFKTGSAWHSPGLEVGNDAAVDDDVTWDRWATPEDTEPSGAAGDYNCVLDLTSLAQKWLAGTNKEYGVFLKTDNEAINNNVQFADREHADTQRPYLEIDYTAVAFYLTGTVKLKGVAVQRTLRCYTRSTGVLYDSTTSNPDGSFQLDAPNATDDMYVICLDDDAGDQYNALIYDRVKGLAT